LIAVDSSGPRRADTFGASSELTSVWRDARNRRLLVVLAVGLFSSYAYFYQGGGWNQNTRFALVRAVLEYGSLSIDPYSDQTGDRALWQGHYYSDKAPGASLLAIVPVGVARLASRIVGMDPVSEPGFVWTSYLATVVTSGVFTLAAAVSIVWLSLSWGFSRPAALFAATGYAVASPAWCYATLFMGHAVAGGSLILAFAATVNLGRAAEARTGHLEWALGLFAGLAVLSDFPSAVPAAIIVGLALMQLHDGNRAVLGRAIGHIAAGGAVAVLILCAYNWMAFASPFRIGYSSEQGFEQLRSGFFGITYPRLWRIVEILLGSYRGLLPISPVLAVTPIGFVLMARARTTARAAWAALSIAAFYIALNASYYYWDGGSTIGPRHIAPALPFLGLGLAPVWDWSRVAGRALLVCAWMWGVALTLIAVSTTPQPPVRFERPFAQLLVPAFLDGDLALNTQGFTDYLPYARIEPGQRVTKVSWNVGMKLGLTGLMSLVPLALIWAASAALLAVPTDDA